MGVGVAVGRGVAVGIGVGVGVAVGIGVFVGGGMAAMVAAIPAATVASMSGVGGGVGVCVGATAWVDGLGGRDPCRYGGLNGRLQVRGGDGYWGFGFSCAACQQECKSQHQCAKGAKNFHKPYLNRDSPDQTNFPGNSSFWDTVKYNLAFQGRQMRPDSLKFLLSWTNRRPAKRKISKPLVYEAAPSC